ncbi:MAG: HEAT repeat domain-containing protein [Alphaproteobacteria bacterium]|uniref:HEAT repeat domain-containing protein n=1 Tax=Candidatus Nitrobium versatile TaxID=2884831 RepID=A0A953LZU3_9BACT|nr:HEAT repeat domain-containing protein [Candidatus Nitrobium versatile]
MVDGELRTMVLDSMEKGFLDNIIDMFKHDEGLYPLIIDMIRDERIRVRLGATALVEELARVRQKALVELIPSLALLLRDPNPTVRGDSASLLGIIRHRDALPYLLDAERDTNSAVREMVRESIQEIEGAG